jgi:hypothetical protein
MSVRLYHQNKIYDGANSKWVNVGSGVTVSFNDQIAAASQNTGAVGCLGQKTVSMSVTLGDIKNSPSTQALDAKIQYSLDGTNWTDLGSGAITQLTAAGTNTVEQKNIGAFSHLRVVWTLAFSGGTVPTADITLALTTISN